MSESSSRRHQDEGAAFEQEMDEPISLVEHCSRCGADATLMLLHGLRPFWLCEQCQSVWPAVPEPAAPPPRPSRTKRDTK